MLKVILVAALLLAANQSFAKKEILVSLQPMNKASLCMRQEEVEEDSIYPKNIYVDVGKITEEASDKPVDVRINGKLFKVEKFDENLSLKTDKKEAVHYTCMVEVSPE